MTMTQQAAPKYVSRRSEGHRAGRLALWHAARLYRDPDRHGHACVQSRSGPCPDQPVRSLSSVSRRLESNRGRVSTSTRSTRVAQFGSVEGTDGPFGAGHGEEVLGDADHRRVEQRAACAGVSHDRQQGRSFRDRRADVEGRPTSGPDRTARANEPVALLGGRTYTGGPDDYAAVHALQDQYKIGPCSHPGATPVHPLRTTCHSKRAFMPRRQCRNKCWRCRPRTSSTVSIACW